MRILILLAMAMLPFATAQSDACVEADPCTWVVEVDQAGLDAPGGPLEATVGDWYVFEFTNLDENGDDHVITSSLGGMSWEVANIDTVTSAPFEIVGEGTHTLSDDVTGDTLEFSGTFADVTEGSGASGEEEYQPAPAVGLLLVVLAALAVVRR